MHIFILVVPLWLPTSNCWSEQGIAIPREAAEGRNRTRSSNEASWVQTKEFNTTSRTEKTAAA